MAANRRVFSQSGTATARHQPALESESGAAPCVRTGGQAATRRKHRRYRNARNGAVGLTAPIRQEQGASERAEAFHRARWNGLPGQSAGKPTSVAASSVAGVFVTDFSSGATRDVGNGMPSTSSLVAHGLSHIRGNTRDIDE